MQNYLLVGMLFSQDNNLVDHLAIPGEVVAAQIQSDDVVAGQDFQMVTAAVAIVTTQQSINIITDLKLSEWFHVCKQETAIIRGFTHII